MIELYSASTPNGIKVSIALEEMSLAYQVHIVDFERRDQFSPEFLELNPNGRIPVIVDTDNDNVFNYIDWNTFTLRAWLHEGRSSFLEDYQGQSTFLKVHSSTFYLDDVRLSWENPFLFFDHDNDG